MGRARTLRLGCLWVGFGLSLLAAGCASTDGGDARDAPASSGARAALTLDVAGDAREGCPQFTAKVPSLAGVAETVTESTYASMVESGRGGASVTCRVAQRGGSFDVTATVQEGPWKLELTTVVSAAHDDAAAAVSLTDTDLNATWSSPAGAGCTISAHLEGSNLAVTPGRLWGKVTCPAFVDAANASARCTASGYVLLDRCER